MYVVVIYCITVECHSLAGAACAWLQAGCTVQHKNSDCAALGALSPTSNVFKIFLSLMMRMNEKILSSKMLLLYLLMTF